MTTINNYKDLISLSETELNFNQILEAVYLFHYTNFKTPMFLTSTNKAEIKKELISIDFQFRQSNQPPIFVLNSLID
jgi:hypothetical protein